MPLNAKQKLFVKAYVASRNATDAARKAGYDSKNPRTSGSELLTNPNVKAAVDAGIEKLAKKHEITADYVLNNIRKILEKKSASDRDKLRATELLGKYLKLFTEVQEISGPNKGPQIILNLPANTREAPTPPKPEEKK